MAENQEIPGPMRRLLVQAPWFPAGVVFLLGLLLTAGGLRFLATTRTEEEQSHEDRRIARVLMTVRSAFDRQEDLLLAARGYFEGSDDIEAREWRAYVASLELSHRHPGVKAFAFIVPVPREGLAVYLADQARRGNPIPVHDQFLARPGDPPQGPPRPELFIIQYLEPAEENPGALGLDVGANPAQREAAEAARDQGHAMLTGPLTFGDLGAREAAAGFFMPVYRGGDSPATVPERRRRFMGWVSIGLWIRPFFSSALVAEGGNLDLEVADLGRSGAGRPHIIFRNGVVGPLPEIQRLKVGGRILELRFKQASFVGSFLAEEALWAAAGILLSLSLAALIWSLARTRVRAERLVEARTRDLSQALALHHAFLDQTPQGIVEFDEGFRVTGWNPGAARIFGYSEAEAMGRSGTFLVGADQEGTVARRWMEPLSKGESLQGVETHLTKDGRTLQCEWRVTALKDPRSGRILGFTSMVEDATERLRLEEGRQQAQRLESLGVLAGGLAHDFNNLLMAIQGHAQIAEQAIEPGHRARVALEKIQRAVDRAAALAHQMLTYAGRARVERRAVDLNQMLLDLGDLLQVSVPKKAELVLDLRQGLPPSLADPTQLQQVAMNLITNAAEALPEGQGRLVLRTMVLDLDAIDLARDFPGQALAPGRYAAMEVEDDGVGMDAATQARIFEPFFTTKFKGRGLGLSAVMGIIRANGGGLRIRSKPGVGTVFTVAFPASEAQQEILGEAGERTWARGGRALIVDDEEGIRAVLREFLSSMGFEVEEAKDGQAGLESLQRRRDFRLAVVDLTMPGLSGLELLAHFRKDSPATRVVLMSGYSEEEATDPGLPAGDAFLAKPFRFADLERVIQQVLEA